MLAAEGGGARVVVLAKDGTPSALAAEIEGRRFVRPNDLIPDANGGVYFTDPGPRPMPGQPVTVKPSVYYVRPDGKAILISDEIARPNGITLSLDGKTLLVADSAGEHVVAFDVQPDGSARNRRNFAQVRDVRRTPNGIQSGADGMAVDSQGRVYVTALSGVQVFSPKGEFLGNIAVPKKPTNLAFGGGDRRTLYITAQDSLYRLRMAARGPEGRAK